MEVGKTWDFMKTAASLHKHHERYRSSSLMILTTSIYYILPYSYLVDNF